MAPRCSTRSRPAAVTGYLASDLHGRPSPQLIHLALIHSYTTVFWWCVAVFEAGAVICGTLLRRGPLTRPGDVLNPEMSHQATTARF